jgi:hypothetical protein
MRSQRKWLLVLLVCICVSGVLFGVWYSRSHTSGSYDDALHGQTWTLIGYRDVGTDYTPPAYTSTPGSTAIFASFTSSTHHFRMWDGCDWATGSYQLVGAHLSLPDLGFTMDQCQFNMSADFEPLVIRLVDICAHPLTRLKVEINLLTLQDDTGQYGLTFMD